MSPQPLVSILIPAYNAEPFLATTLESVLAQTYRHIEVILVNDGSRDRTLEIARTFESRGLRIIDQPNAGQSAAFNTAYRQCRGDYISFFDADDLLSPDKIERQVAALPEAGDDVMMTCAWARFYDDPAEARFVPQHCWKDMAPVDWLVRTWEHNEMMHGATWLIPRAVLDRSGLWNPELSLINDHEFFCRVMLQCRLIKFVEGPRTWYRSGLGSSLSKQHSPRALLSAWKALDLSTDALLAVEDSARTRRACATKMQRFVYEIYPAAPDLAAKAQRRANELGGSDLQPDGGPLFKACRTFLGWKGARRVQRLVYRLGYMKAGYRVRQMRARPAGGD